MQYQTRSTASILRVGVLLGGLTAAFLPTVACAGLFEDSVSGDVSNADSASSASMESASDRTEADGTETEAETGDASAPAPTVVERIVERTGLDFDFNGHIRGDLFIGKMPDYSRVEIKNGYGELALKLKVSKGSYGSAFADVRFQGGFLNDQHYLGQPSDTAASGEDLWEFDASVKLREAYINVYAGSHFDLKFGQQIIVWGRADGINPTNNLTPIDMRVRSADEDDRRLSNLALRMNLNFSPVRIEGVWVPFYVPSLMPSINLESDYTLEFTDPKYPNKDVTKGTYAGKIHLLLPAVEMSLSYLYGHSLIPGVSIEDTFVDQNLVILRRTAFQHHVAGFDFSTVIAGKVGFRGEAAFKYPVDYKDEQPYERSDFDYQVAVPNPEVYYVLGLDKEFGNVMLLAQYIGKTVINWEEVQDAMITGYSQLTAKNRIIQGQTEQYQHGVSGRIEWKTLHDTLSLSAFGMVNVSTKEWLVYPKIGYNITDAMLLTVGAEIYQGPSESLFGYVEEILTAGYTELKIAF